MENRPVIRILARTIQPEYEERFLKWQYEVYFPLYITVDEIQEISGYQILRNNPQYPPSLNILHYRNRTDQMNLRKNQKYIDITKDSNTTWGPRIEPIWMVAYELIKSLQNVPIKSKRGTLSEVNPNTIIHLEGCTLLQGEAEKYERWFTKWGNEVYMPIMMKLCGLVEFAWYRCIDVDLTGLASYLIPKRPVEYPSYLSVLTFESPDAYDNYEKSPELAAFRYALRVPFPRGLEYKWYIQYQLEKSFRK
jgi:hypothetical protein